MTSAILSNSQTSVLATTFGLTGFELPHGTTYHPGDTVTASFAWLVDDTITQNYSIAWFIAHENAAALPVQGIDSPPDAGFLPFTQLQPGIPAWDNRAIYLPSTLPEGNYQLWLKIYGHIDANIVELPVTVGTVQDDATAILPMTIHITSKN